jgi:hypothetical protein
MRRRLVFTAVLGLGALCGCKKDTAKPAEPAAAPTARALKQQERASGKAEVEFFGKWTAAELKPAKVVFVAQVEPCVPVPAKPTRLGEAALKVEPGTLFAEFFIPQGTVGHACVYALDERGEVIGAGGTKENPLTFEGEGEVIKGNLDFTLAPVAK